MTFAQRSSAAGRSWLERGIVPYVVAVVAVTVAFAVRRLLLPADETGAAFALLMGAVLVTNLVAGHRAGIVAIALGALLGSEDFLALSATRPGEAISQAFAFAIVGAGVVSIAYSRARAKIDVDALRRVDDQRKMFVALVENSSDFIGIIDRRGMPVYLNPAGRRMVGFAKDAPIGHTTIPEYYTPDQRAFATDVIVESVLANGRWRGETFFRNWQTNQAIPVSDEHFKVFDETGRRLLGFGTITRDISEVRRVEYELEHLLERERKARREIEAANVQLRESEERFRLTLDEAPIGMALVALDGRFVRVNEALCQLVGYSADELRQLRFQDVTHPDDLGTDLEVAQKLVRGEIPRMHLEKRYIRKDGGVVTVLLHTGILHAPDGTPLYFISQISDITERKRVEEALRFSEARFSGIIAIAAEAIISIDEDQRITLFNDGAEMAFGYAREEVLGRPVDILIPERYHSRHRAEVTRFLEGPETARTMMSRPIELVGLHKNGEEFPVEAAISKLKIDRTVTMTVVLRDVTEQRRSQREARYLAEAGKILSSSLDYEQTLVTVGMLVVRELANWCVIQLAETESQPRRLKLIPDDPAMQPFVDEIEGAQSARNLPRIAESVWETRKPIVYESLTSDELAALTQSSQHLRLMQAIRAHSLMIVPLAIGQRLLGILGFVLTTPDRRYTSSDIPFATALADRAALAIENGRLYHSALQATKLRDQVLGVVAHDLRNPLTLIQLQTSSLEAKPGMPERRDQKPKQLILRATDRMNHLIQDLLDISQIEAGQLSIERAPVATDLLLEDIVESERKLATAQGLELRLDLHPPIADVLGDHDRISQVLENLIGNAIKFTPPGGGITVGARTEERHVLFWIADTGSGIAADNIDRVFDRFWQVQKGSRHGAGLGLPIARGIVEAHGGRIWVESTIGRGTTFHFTLPRAPSTGVTSGRPDALETGHDREHVH